MHINVYMQNLEKGTEEPVCRAAIDIENECVAKGVGKGIE